MCLIYMKLTYERQPDLRTPSSDMTRLTQIEFTCKFVLDLRQLDSNFTYLMQIELTR